MVQPPWKFHKQLKTERPHDPAVSLLGAYLRKMQTLSQKDIWSLMFIAVLFTVVMIWKQPKCPSKDKWIKKMWCIYKIYT